jgi:hypothetical protein
VRLHYSHDVEGKLVPYVADHTVGLQVTFAFQPFRTANCG